MARSFAFGFILFLCLTQTLTLSLSSGGGGGARSGGGGGGFRGGSSSSSARISSPSISRSPSVSRPSTPSMRSSTNFMMSPSRPVSRPSTPSMRPTVRPSSPSVRPITRPSSPSVRPPVARPSVRPPVTRPSTPSVRPPVTRPTTPSVKPISRPTAPVHRPTTPKPANPINKPNTLKAVAPPAQRPAHLIQTPRPNPTPMTPRPNGAHTPTSFYQVNPAWKNLPLGNGKTTIGKGGCAVSSLAAMADKAGVKINGATPNTLNMNNWLKQNGGFGQGSSLVDMTAMSKLGFRAGDKIPAGNKAALIEGMGQGKSVILNVGGHYVYATGHDATGFTVVDPGHQFRNHYNFDQVHSARMFSR